MPPGLSDAQPAPLVVSLHGAGSHASAGLALLREQAERRGFVLLAPQSSASTWDVIAADYGPDVAAIECSLAELFERVPIDRQRLAIGGFSDGASYALSLGLTNGDLFTHVLAFSPGFAAPAAPRGRPAIFVTHGIADRVLPIERCSRRLVPRLRRAGYHVRYEEFEGGHVLPPQLADRAVAWLLD